jgi:acyl carrier protein
MSRDAIFDQLRTIMAELFELDPGAIRGDSTVFDELDLDSIDAVDLVAKLQQITGTRIEEQQMRGVRTVDDLVDVVVARAAAS